MNICIIDEVIGERIEECKVGNCLVEKNVKTQSLLMKKARRTHSHHKYILDTIHGLICKIYVKVLYMIMTKSYLGIY